ncbi:MAG: ATP-dependent DNA helicase [Candidatus Aenigmarchaeota archaeon]|nr:ATP-dependent DNA helicase [Candidatus Aenigmarchaeota archaeon]
MRFFPFDKIRAGQKDFMEDVANCVASGNHLLADAPTGIGKTAAVLVPAMEYAVDNGKVVFFLTSRHSQHRIVIETIKKMNQKGAGIVAADIIGKKWLCNQPAVDTLPMPDFFEFCKRMRETGRCAFFNKTIENQKFTKSAYACLHDIKKQPRHAEEIKDMARLHCSYEIVLRLARESSLVIGDYYHMFSIIREQLLGRMKKELGDCILIVDEAHNLPERVRKLLSQRMSTLGLHNARKEAEELKDDELTEKIDLIKSIVNEQYSGEDRFVKKQELISGIESSCDYFDLITSLSEAADIVRDEKRKSFIGGIAGFLQAWPGEDEGFARILKSETIRKKKVITLHYDCLDPSLITRDIFTAIHSSVLMSGTLRPAEMYRDVLGLEAGRSVYREYKSDFPRENRLNIALPDVTTKYTERNDEQYRTMASYINKCASKIPGNIAVFFPSYSMRDMVMNFLTTDKMLFIEEQGMTKKEKNILYETFISSYTEGGMLLGAQSGSYAEGTDYPGEALNAVIVVGVALEKPTLKVQALIDHYNKKFGKGWEYAYVYPAVLRALQTAGRCIRSETDRGVCIFMDKRFLWNNYRKLFPRDMAIHVTKSPEVLIENFFRQNFKLYKDNAYIN